MADADSMPQPGPGRQWFEKTLVEQRGSADRLARLHRALRYWFRRDTWTSDEAFPLLAGIDPDSFAVGDSHVRYLDGSLVCIAASMLAHGIEWPAASFDDVDSLRNLQAVPVILAEMKRVWLSGNHPPRNEPGYFIEWARRKRFDVPWLESAHGLSLIEIAENNTLVDPSAKDATAAPATPEHAIDFPASPEPEMLARGKTAEAMPAALSSPEIAAAFDGLNGWTEKEWSQALGDGRTEWLKRARVSIGRRGGGAASWNPVVIALALHDKNAKLPALDAVFKKSALHAWRKKWENDTELLR